MINEFVFDEIDVVSTLLSKNINFIKANRKHREITLVCDEHSLMFYLAGSFAHAASKGIIDAEVNVVFEGEASHKDILDDLSTKISQDVPCINMYNGYSDYIKRENSDSQTFFIYFINTRLEKYKSAEIKNNKLNNLKTWLDCACERRDAKFLCVNIIPPMEEIKEPYTAVSEVEYEVINSQKDLDSIEAFELNAERILRDYVKKGLFAECARFDNIFGPMVSDENMLNLPKIADEIKTTGKITLNKSEASDVFSACYIRFAMYAVYFILFTAPNGNIYNIAPYSFTKLDIATEVYKLFSKKGVTLDLIGVDAKKPKSYRVESRKILSLGMRLLSTPDEQLYKCMVSLLPELDLGYYVTEECYDGKLTKIKQTELVMMDEIDRICKKHDIKYFMVGGSLLGAVRHKGFIPWDDDFDIGMLRKDYNKFKKVCPKELKEGFCYQSYRDEKTSHYIFDKVRLKDTFFTTSFSGKFLIENGFFIDILVYDKTSDLKFLQKLHINALHAWKRVLNIKWYNKPRKNVHYYKSRILLPVMRIIPFGFFHGVFEFLLRFYNFKKHGKHLIDGVGMNLKRGAFPADFFDDVIPMQFEDRVFPAPAKYDEYLRHWYGDRYNELLPYSTRKSGHNLTRIDLGKYVKDDPDDSFRHIDCRGELF
ncbi:MAG: LicD family protein [Clostridiales bacterium]|nr:LicD family protein [Clostridiales bacterium]